MNIRFFEAFAAGLVVVVLSIVTGCGQTRSSLPADYTVHVKDPLFQKLATVTERVSVKASGLIAPGTYVMHNVPIKVNEPTSFDLSITVPVNGSTDISMSHAVGSLNLNHPVTIMNVPSPQSIELGGGSISANVDFARMICSFLIGNIQNADTVNTDSAHDSDRPITNLVNNCQIQKAQFLLKPSADASLENLRFRVKPASSVTMEDLDFKGKSDYAGRIAVDLKCSDLVASTKDKNRTLTGSSGDIHLNLTIARQANAITIGLQKMGKPSEILLNQGNLSDVANSVTFESGTLALNAFDFKRSGNDPRIDLNFDGTVSLTAAKAAIGQHNAKAIATIPALNNATLVLNQQSGNTSYKFLAQNILAQGITFNVASPKGDLSMRLKQGELHSLEMTKEQGLGLRLDKGTWEPTSISVHNKNAAPLDIQFSPGSSVSLSGFGAARAQDQKLADIDTVPVVLKSSGLKISNGRNHFACSDLSGTIVFGISNDTIKADGKLSVKLDSLQNPLNIPGVGATIKDLELHHSGNKTLLALNKCTFTIPTKQLKEALQQGLPREKRFSVNKLVMDKRRWRYRNVMLNQVTVKDPKIDNIAVTPQGSLKIQGDAEVQANGTIERVEIHPLQMPRTVWNSHPWSAHGHATGSGIVALKFNPGKTLATSSIDYSADCSLPVPEDLSIDWSGVAGDVLAGAELKIMQGVIKNAGFFLPDKGIPLQFAGRIQPFAQKKGSHADQLKVSNCTLKSMPAGIGIALDAQLDF